MGGTHRHAFLEDIGEQFRKRETKAMMKRVKRYAENKMRLADKIKTVQCDASYPLPATLLPAPGTFQRPKNAEEAQEMLDTAMRMMQKVADFAKKEHQVSEQEAAVLKQTFNLGSNGPF